MSSRPVSSTPTAFRYRLGAGVIIGVLFAAVWSARGSGMPEGFDHLYWKGLPLKSTTSKQTGTASRPVPRIDAAAPKKFETATFALG